MNRKRERERERKRESERETKLEKMWPTNRKQTRSISLSLTLPHFLFLPTALRITHSTYTHGVHSERER